VPPEIILVSESGVKSGDDVKLLSSYGADALLVGTSIMKSNEMYHKNLINKFEESIKEFSNL